MGGLVVQLVHHGTAATSVSGYVCMAWLYSWVIRVQRTDLALVLSGWPSVQLIHHAAAATSVSGSALVPWCTDASSFGQRKKVQRGHLSLFLCGRPSVQLILMVTAATSVSDSVWAA